MRFAKLQHQIPIKALLKAKVALVPLFVRKKLGFVQMGQLLPEMRRIIVSSILVRMVVHPLWLSANGERCTRAAIDASGELPDGTTVVGANQLRKLLVEQHQDQFVRCFVEKMLTYALGRGLEYYDKCAVDRIIQSLENSDYRFSQLLLAIVQSDPFQKKGEREIEL